MTTGLVLSLLGDKIDNPEWCLHEPNDGLLGSQVLLYAALGYCWVDGSSQFRPTSRWICQKPGITHELVRVVVLAIVAIVILVVIVLLVIFDEKIDVFLYSAVRCSALEEEPEMATRTSASAEASAGETIRLC
jgi:hypothetical protein